MAKCKAGRNGCKARIVSEAAARAKGPECFDVCAAPLCGSPDYLGLFAPVIYDEIGINLCTTFTLSADIPSAYPTAVSAWVQVVNISYAYGDDNVEIVPITGRANCYAVTLSNLCVQFAVYLYDAACRLLDTLYETAVYLPSDTCAETYDEDTNPAAVELDIFAPYGVSYNMDGCAYSLALNNIGFLSADNSLRQGLSLYALPKTLDFDVAGSALTVGLTLVLQSLYFAGYRVQSAGKINIPKGSIQTDADTLCMRFVDGSLLNLDIKPLELGPPACEESLKRDCAEDCRSDCEELGAALT